MCSCVRAELETSVTERSASETHDREVDTQPIMRYLKLCGSKPKGLLGFRKKNDTVR